MLREDISLEYLDSKKTTSSSDFLGAVDLATNSFIRDCLINHSVFGIEKYSKDLDAMFVTQSEDMDELYDKVFGYFDLHLSDMRSMELLNMCRQGLENDGDLSILSEDVDSIDDLLTLYGLMHLVQFSIKKNQRG